MAALLIAVVVIALIAEKWSLTHALDGVEYDTEPDRKLVEIDEPFAIRTILKNRSRRIVPFLRMTEELPRDMHTELLTGSTGTAFETQQTLKSTVFLMPKQQLTRSFEASLPARGRYFLHGATLHGGDFIGLRETSRSEPRLREIVVLPAPCTIPDITEMVGGFLGDISVNRFIMEDPVLTLGYREYTGREPMKTISWQQTLRTGKMMVKNFDHTADLSVSLVLNVYDADSLGKNHAVMEKAYSMTRSAAEELERRGIAYSFYTNAVAAGASMPFRHLPEGFGQAHLNAVLEGLGRATYDACESFYDMVEHIERSADKGRACIMITAVCDAACQKRLLQFRELTGSPLLLLRADEEAAV